MGEEGMGNHVIAIRKIQVTLMDLNIGLKVMEVKNCMIQKMRLIYQHPFQLSAQCRDVYQPQMKTPYAHFPQRVELMELEMLHPLKMLHPVSYLPVLEAFYLESQCQIC